MNDLIKYGIGIFTGFSFFDYFIKGESGWSMLLGNVITGVLAALLYGVFIRYRKNKKTKKQA